MNQKSIVFLFLISSTFGCLIINCPRGGKRNGALALKHTIRECSSCGPDKQGQCFGPKICCGPSIGCFIGTPETYGCSRKESLYSRPCIAGYAMCRGNTGRCAADGICCSQESCNMDASCRILDNAIANIKSPSTIIDANAFYPENNSLNDQN